MHCCFIVVGKYILVRLSNTWWTRRLGFQHTRWKSVWCCSCPCSSLQSWWWVFCVSIDQYLLNWLSLSVFTLDSLGPGLVYLGPSESVANPCRCNTVYYSMLSACAACQGNRWIRFVFTFFSRAHHFLNNIESIAGMSTVLTVRHHMIQSGKPPFCLKTGS